MLELPGQNALQSSIALADAIVYKTYLEGLAGMEIVPCPENLPGTDINDMARFFRIERFVYAKNEPVRDKLVSVFQAVARCSGSVIILINSNGKTVDFCAAAKTDSLNDLADAAEALHKSFTGNFPGTLLSPVGGGKPIRELLGQVFTNAAHPKDPKWLCAVTGVAGLRRKDDYGEKQFTQGLEKFIDAMQGEKYSLLLIADPVPQARIDQIRRGYETLYSELSPFAGNSLNFGQNESSSISSSVSESVSESINRSVSDTMSYSRGTSKSFSENESNSVGVHASYFFVGASYSHGWNSGRSWSETENRANSQSVTNNQGQSVSRQEGRGASEAKGSSRGIQIKFENKQIKNLLEKINLQLKRLDASGDTGMWNCSVYCLADNPSTSKIAASAYQSLLRGENSSIEAGAITVWPKNKIPQILPYLEKMRHPRLLMGGLELGPTSFISSAELAIGAHIPQTSVGGLPVLSIAPFGREVVSSRSVNPDFLPVALGKIYHMGKVDAAGDAQALPVVLDAKSLASHTFITGSTGSGKSNTVYQLLGEMTRQGARFMVIEPAKGEYKHVFGMDPGVSVYGTNPKKTPLLRINPFTFPPDIHILEHLDRLVEIFNVCWPMYAAMPAVLKESIEGAYQACGWNLQTSENSFSPPLYPAFTDVAASLNRVIDSSAYSEENRGNYKGALETRLKSLGNGINGMIFARDELGGAELFEQNVIVDLSRVGSAETKSLIMGLLIMKLQEHRLTSDRLNPALPHITVLEEAHNLLKRVSMEQSGEGANILGKSVEMLANAIAEMRSYGEGFIIADQSPGLLDMSVIRNTNTKIILRLPDQGDRELVGKAASLNNDQISELAKLECGVAAVYQNDWIQPVLCKVEHFAEPRTRYHWENPEPLEAAQNREDTPGLKAGVVNYLLRGGALSREQVDSLKDRVLRSAFNNALKTRLFRYLETEKSPGGIETVTDIIAALFPFESAALKRAVNGFPLTDSWARSFYNEIKPHISMFDHETRELIMRCVIVEEAQKRGLRDICTQWNELNWRIESDGTVEKTGNSKN